MQFIMQYLLFNKLPNIILYILYNIIFNNIKFIDLNNMFYW